MSLTITHYSLQVGNVVKKQRQQKQNKTKLQPLCLIFTGKKKNTTMTQRIFQTTANKKKKQQFCCSTDFSTIPLNTGKLCSYVGNRLVGKTHSTVESRLFEPIFFSKLLGKRQLARKIGFRKLEGGTKSRLIYEVLFYNNRESKQKYHDTLVQFKLSSSLDFI